MEQLKIDARIKIQEAFQFTPAPDHENLITNKVGLAVESRKIIKAFRGKRWENVSPKEVKSCGEALSLFTSAAFRYYLPTYMLSCVDFYYSIDVARDSVILNLTPPENHFGWEWRFFDERVQLFNKEECKAIKLFLEFLEQYELTDWLNEGVTQPVSRIKAALNFWTELAEKN